MLKVYERLWVNTRRSLEEMTILEIKPPSTRIQILLNPQRFFADPASVHTYPVNPAADESATF